MSGDPHGSELAEPSPFGDFLRAHRGDILARWLSAVRDCSPASRLAEEELVDHIPLVFDRLTDTVDAISANAWGSIQVEAAKNHALVRLSEGFDLSGVVTELFLLRHVLQEFLWAHRQPGGTRLGETLTLHWAIDAAIRESVDAYSSARQRPIETLEQMSEAALESRSIGDLLPRLLHAIVDTTSGVDTAAIFLVDGDRLSMGAALGVEADLMPSFSVGFGEGLTGRVAAERRPMLARAPEIESPVLRDRGLLTIFGLPLMAGDELLGVIQMGSLTVSDFSPRDKLFLELVAERVAAAVLQHELRERAERAARARDEALALLGSMFATAPIGLAFLDRDLRFVRVNEALARIFEVPVEAHIGKRLSELFPGIAQVHEIEAEWRRIIDTGESKLDVEVSGVLPSKPHELRFWRNSWYAVRVGDQIVGLGVVAADITRARQEEHFHQHIIGIASHDLRTPITAIRLSADALTMRHDLSGRHANTARRIQASVARLESIVCDLLDVTRIRAGQGLVINRSPLDLNTMCQQLLEEAHAAHPSHRFRAEHSGDLRGEWDAGRLAQAISNLVTNAVSHSPVDAPITLRCTAEDGSVSVEIENHGPRIEPELLPHIFEPFRRGERAGRGGGLGLGLFITRQIVEAHGGSISVSSTEERTIFRLHLPRDGAP